MERSVDPFQSMPSIHPKLPAMRLVNRRTLEHAGPCPFCGGSGPRSDRFHVWLEPGKERYWCRSCDAKGALATLLGDDRPMPRLALRRPRRSQRPTPVSADTPHYRALYTVVALWAHDNLLDPANPDPAAYLAARGINAPTIAQAVLGVTRRDPSVLADLLTREHAELLPYAEAAGVLFRDHDGTLVTHPNLCGCLVFPYLADGVVTDLRTRSFPGKGYRSLAGGYTERGATAPFGWDSLDGCDTVIITEGELKALATTQAYRAGRLSMPALAHPGLSYLREEWGPALVARGVHTVILAYDSQPRPVKDGVLQLAPEEIWTIRHGQDLAAAGLTVRALRLPLESDAPKADLDAFLLSHSPARLQQLCDTAPALESYHRSLPRHLLRAARLPDPGDYPLRRARPQRLADVARPRPAPTATTTLEAARAQIAVDVYAHIVHGQGVLVLAHPPGAGKGHNATIGIRAYLQAHPTPGQIVWTALRKDQIQDQSGLELTPLHGRNQANCRKLGEAQALSARGYPVRDTLCARRCPFVDSCTYLRQFTQDADFFASQPLLQATSWWQQAAVVVLDEFDPARLTRIVALDSADLARISQRVTSGDAQTLLRWLATLMGSATDRALPGSLLFAELTALAHCDGLDLSTTLAQARAALPPEEEQAMLPGFPKGATMADYEALPPNYLTTIITQLAREHDRFRAGQRWTSRLEVAGGRLWLYLRIEHLIQQLANPDQPKIILDATASEALLQAIFPTLPLRIAQPRIAGGAKVIQVVTRDWAKSTLRGERRTRWYDTVARHIRPDRPTLVVCTLACEQGLREALAARGHTQVVVSHYGALRGSNSFKGYDVILAQVYHPNLDALIREGRALFADDPEPLDERTLVTERTLTDAAGATWVVQVPTCADPRLAALLEQRRESELVQAALRGRPFDHPETQITLLCGLPLPSLPPTEVREDDDTAPTSNTGRAATAREAVATATAQLLARNVRVISVEDLAQVTGQSVVTIRRHLAAVAGRLGLRLISERRAVVRLGGGTRAYTRTVLVRKGRWAPAPSSASSAPASAPEGTDHARNMLSPTRVIRARRTMPPVLLPRGRRRVRRDGARPRPPWRRR